MTSTASGQHLGGAHIRQISVFDRNGVGTTVASADAPPEELIRRATRERGFVWIDMVDPDAGDLAPWAEALDLHPLAVEEAASGDQQPTVQGFGDQICVVLWASVSLDRPRGGDVPKLFLFLGDHFVLSVVRDPGGDVFDLRRRFADQPQYLREGPAGTLYVVLATLVEHFTGIVQDVERELADLETVVFDQAVIDDAGRIYQLRQRLGRLERPLSSLVHSLSRTPDSLTRLIQRHPALAPYLADAIDDLMGLGGLVSDQRTSLDTIVASHENNVAQQQNADMRRISAYGALLAVPTVIAGLYGMNFKHLPGTSWDLGWLVVLIAVVVIDAVIFVAFQRRKWL